MDARKLHGFLVTKPTLDHVLGKYRGSYNMGVGSDPHQRTKEPVIILRVLDLTLETFPTEIKLDDEIVYIITERNLQDAHPLGID